MRTYNYGGQMKHIILIGVFIISLCALSLAQAPKTAHDKMTTVGKPDSSTGLVLLSDEGERMVRRWGLKMTIKIDPVNGGSKRLLVGTEDIPPGKSIPVHKHSHCDEVLIVLQGKGTAILGEKRREVSAGAIVFIPEDEWVGLENTGNEMIRIVFIFSELGFDQYLHATSVPEGQKVVPFTAKELAEIREKFKGVITFKE